MSDVLGIAEGIMNQVLNKNEELVKARRAICSHCNLYNQADDTCTSCGCPIDRKARVERKHCPIKKW